MTRDRFHPSWPVQQASWQEPRFDARELLATDMALGSVDRVLNSLDRMAAHDAQIEQTLADYRALSAPRAITERNG